MAPNETDCEDRLERDVHTDGQDKGETTWPAQDIPTSQTGALMAPGEACEKDTGSWDGSPSPERFTIETGRSDGDWQDPDQTGRDTQD